MFIKTHPIFLFLFTYIYSFVFAFAAQVQISQETQQILSQGNIICSAMSPNLQVLVFMTQSSSNIQVFQLNSNKAIYQSRGNIEIPLIEVQSTGCKIFLSSTGNTLIVHRQQTVQLLMYIYNGESFIQDQISLQSNPLKVSVSKDFSVMLIYSVDRTIRMYDIQQQSSIVFKSIIMQSADIFKINDQTLSYICFQNSQLQVSQIYKRNGSSYQQVYRIPNLLKQIQERSNGTILTITKQNYIYYQTEGQMVANPQQLCPSILSLSIRNSVIIALCFQLQSNGTAILIAGEYDFVQKGFFTLQNTVVPLNMYVSQNGDSFTVIDSTKITLGSIKWIDNSEDSSNNTIDNNTTDNQSDDTVIIVVSTVCGVLVILSISVIIFLKLKHKGPFRNIEQKQRQYRKQESVFQIGIIGNQVPLSFD